MLNFEITRSFSKAPAQFWLFFTVLGDFCACLAILGYFSLYLAITAPVWRFCIVAPNTSAVIGDFRGDFSATVATSGDSGPWRLLATRAPPGGDSVPSAQCGQMWRFVAKLAIFGPVWRHFGDWRFFWRLQLKLAILLAISETIGDFFSVLATFHKIAGMWLQLQVSRLATPRDAWDYPTRSQPMHALSALSLSHS